MRTNRAIKEALKKLPVGLDDTYERILSSIGDDDFEIASKSLRWLVHSARPLSLEELAEAITVVPNQDKLDENARLTNPDVLFEILSSLLSATPKSVGLSHFTVREYLSSDRILSASPRISRYAITEAESHSELGKVCFTYLSFNDFRSPPCVNPVALQSRLNDFPLLEYSARFGPLHAREGYIQPEEPWFTELFSLRKSEKFLCWQEVRNYQDRVDSSPDWEAYVYDDDEEGPLSVVIGYNLVSFARKLVELGADVNSQGGRYGNPLQAAALTGNSEIVRLLLERKAKVNARGGYFGNPLQAAGISGDCETVRLLLDHGADPDGR